VWTRGRGFSSRDSRPACAAPVRLAFAVPARGRAPLDAYARAVEQLCYAIVHRHVCEEARVRLERNAASLTY
jgi:hypothetical protein